MNGKGKSLNDRIKQYHFELRHVLVLFIILAASQLLVSFVQKVSLQNFLVRTQDSYQRDSAERLANLTATSLELLLETAPQLAPEESLETRKIVEAFNIIFSQQLLLEHVKEVCVLLPFDDQIHAVDNGEVLYDYFFRNPSTMAPPDIPHTDAVSYFMELEEKLKFSEQVQSVLEGRQTFHVLVPFVPKGELAGALYMKNAPDFTVITEEIAAGFSESSMVFTGLILFGLIAMFYISSYTVRERDDAQELLFKEREKQLEERINYQKETMFTKRIYHTYHKAEKVMGFIKEDLRSIEENNIDEIKDRVTKYANFVSRAIYDMKWYDPPLQAIRNPIFKTDLNGVLTFVVEHICQRNARQSDLHTFVMNLDKSLPTVQVNEFVVWEIFEPLLQNCMDHNDEEGISITVTTRYDQASGTSTITIADNGKGILPELLEADANGVKQLFKEEVSTKEVKENSGYGCYLAYEIAKQRCRWDLDAHNLPTGGCCFTLTIPMSEPERL